MCVDKIGSSFGREKRRTVNLIFLVLNFEVIILDFYWIVKFQKGGGKFKERWELVENCHPREIKLFSSKFAMEIMINSFEEKYSIFLKVERDIRFLSYMLQASCTLVFVLESFPLFSSTHCLNFN